MPRHACTIVVEALRGSSSNTSGQFRPSIADINCCRGTRFLWRIDQLRSGEEDCRLET